MSQDRRWSPWRFVACTVVCFAMIACAEPGFDGRVFRSGNIAFELSSLPSSWRQIEVTDTAVAFRDDSRNATIAVNGRCGKDADDVPLRSLTQHLFIHFTERAIIEQQTIELDAREALVTDASAKLDGVKKHFRVVVLKKDGCVYDLMLIARSQPSSAQLEEFDGFVRGFSALRA